MKRSRKALLMLLGMAALLAVVLYIFNELSGRQRIRLDHPDRVQTLLLKAPPGRGQVFGVELHFVGELSGEALISLGEAGQPFVAKTRIKAGAVDTRFRSDWYMEELPLRYEPRGKVKGRLRIEYRFFRSGG